MKRVIEKGSGLIIVVVAAMLVMGLAVAPVYAVPIVFNMGYGGTVSYAGGDNPFTTTDGAVTSVSNGVTTISITGGDLDFETGNYSDGSVTATGFENKYAAGGSVTISGDIGSGTATLLSGAFADEATFSCCSGSAYVSVSSFSGLLSISSINPDLASALGFYTPPTGGSIAQVEIFFGSIPQGPNKGFSGVQGGGAVSVSDSIPVPEPMTILLLGLGLVSVSLGAWVRRVKFFVK